jgi:hypothetical protein
MSVTDGPAFAEEADVQAAMQEADSAFAETPLGTVNVETAIVAASRWFRQRAQAHFYDSTADPGDLISSAPATATGITMSIPASPAPQDGTLRQVTEGINRSASYPVTKRGVYARAKEQTGTPGLPYRYVESIDALEVRDIGGEVEDWVAGSETEGRGEDYYLEVEGNDSRGRSHLYINAGTLGARQDYDGVLTVDVTYGRDWQDSEWPDVRRGIAHLAAAELVVDDDVLTQIPDNGAIANVQTQADVHLSAAIDRYLSPYLSAGVA